MSDSTRLPARPSLQQLHKQAKDLLRLYRAGDPAALHRVRAFNPRDPFTLASAQFVIAREHGFDTWAHMKHHVEALRPPGLAHYERLTAELSAALTSRDAAAIREINWNYGTAFVLNSDPADAPTIVAHSYGHASWADLARSVAQPAPDPRSSPVFLSRTPPFYKIDWTTNTISVRGPLSDSDCDAVLAVMQDHRIDKLNAGAVTDAAMHRLAQLDLITHLHLGGSKTLTDDGIKHLAAMPQLHDLQLGGPSSPITDRALDVLRHLPNLRRFESTWTPGITDAGAANLASCDHLEEVNLMGTAAGDGLIRALTGKRRLRKLKTGRSTADAGLTLLRELPNFTTWNGGDLEYGLMSAEAEPNHLLLDGPFTDSGLQNLAALHGLFALTFFWHCPAFTAAGLSSLRLLPNLGFLGIQDDHCEDEAMRHIAALPKLRMLMGQGAVASDKGFEALSRSPTIEYIWGRECPNLTGRGFRALAAMPCLRGLAVSCKNVDDASLAALPRFPALRELVPMHVSDDGFRHVGRCENLEALWCMYCRDTGDAATEHIAGLPSLKTYYAGMTQITDRSLEILARMSSLERLEFWQCAGITDAGIAHLARIPNLREITLDGLPAATRDAAALFPARVRVNYSG